jgi:dynein heavy chain, axonemal
LNDLV